MKRGLQPGWRALTLGTALSFLAGCNSSAPPNDSEPKETSQPVESAAKQPAKTPAVKRDAAASAEAPETAQGAEQPAAGLQPPPPFEGWNKPVLALVLTGQQMGYIEPCGCTGLQNQKGGLARRATLIRQLREEKGWEVVPLDAGNQVRRYGRQPVIKFRRTAEALRMMGYRAATFGESDLGLETGELVAAVKPDDQPTIFTSANVALFDRSFTPPWQIIEAAGKKLGVVAVLGESLRKNLQGSDVVHEPAEEALQAAVAELQAAGCDLFVLLAQASLEESRELAKRAKVFDLVVSAGGIGEPTFELEKIDGLKTQLAQVGTKGMYVGVVGIFDDAAMPLRYQRLALDSGYADAPEMLTLLADYQEELRREGLAAVGATEQPHPSGSKFLGTAKCGECHTKALAVWEQTPHAHATDSIVEPPNSRGHIARHYDPECLSCHVTGWEPQKFFPFTSGYLSLEKSAHLTGNGCENCHGPGSAHVEAEESGAGQELLAKLRDQMRLPLAGDRAKHKCLECHDLDNDPHFNFEKYWPQVEHVGKD